ncbi:translocation/assembly module TamB domain-containing protein [Nitratidesulfovibrio sp. 1201_IL3209]|uniref:translocation/assembly module TamB domain-containing protein n=1 Tax=Nitratidesulfovibrio sp. 1201_IL3209 TaxID=3084053 RepID=UPI002FD97A30
MTDPHRHTAPGTAPPTPPAPPEGKRRTRRPWRTLGFAALATLAALLLALGAGAAFLRSAPGEAWLAAQAVRLLAAAGVTATLDGLEGPLPQRLLLRNLTLADGRGPWLHVDEAEIRLRPLALLHVTLDVELVRVTSPRWERMPEMPDSGEPNPDDGAAFDPLALPVRMRLGELAVHHAVLGAELLGRQLTFSLRGALDAPVGAVSARLQLDREPVPAGNGPDIPAPDGSATNVSGTAPPGGLALALSYAARSGDLQLDVTGGEDAGGLLGCLAGQPDLPAYGLRLAGRGSGGRWHGWLAASAGDLLRLDGEADAELDASAPGIAAWLAGRKDSVWRADLHLTAQAGADAPAELRRWTGSSGMPDSPDTGLTLRAQASGRHGRDGMALDIPLLALDGGAWSLELADGTLHAPAGTALAAPMDLRASVRSRLRDAAALLPDAPLRTAEAALTVHGRLNGPDGDALALSGRGDLRGVAAAAHADIAVDMDGTLHRTGQRLALDGLRLAAGLASDPAARDGNGDAGRPDGDAAPQAVPSVPLTILTALTGGGAWDAATRQATASLAAELPDLPGLLALLTPPAPATGSGPGLTPGTPGKSPATPPPLLAGNARLDADLDLRLPPVPGAEPTGVPPGLRLTLRGQGDGLRWHSPQLQHLLGASPALSAQASGGYAAPLRLELRELAGTRLSGRGTASLAAPASENGTAPGLLPPVTGASVLDAAARLTVTDVNGLLASDGQQTKGTPTRAAHNDEDTLTLDLDANGMLAAPKVRLSAVLPSLVLPTVGVRGLAARLEADLNLPVAAPHPAGTTHPGGMAAPATPPAESLAPPLSGRGSLNISASDALGAPLAVDAHWRLEQRGERGEERGNARVDLTRAEGAGLRGLASLAASWRNAAAAPTLSGTADMAVADWSALSRAAGTSLSGGSARLRVRLGDGSPLPALAAAGGAATPLHAEATADRLSIGGAATLDTLSLTLDIRDIQDMRDGAPPRGAARLRTGPGRAAGLAWDAANATLGMGDSGGNNGGNNGAPTPGAAFALALRGRSTADVRGGYDAAAQILRLDTLHLSDATHGARVALVRPTDIALADGVRVDGLRLALDATPPGAPGSRRAGRNGRPAASASTSSTSSTGTPTTGSLDVSLDLHGDAAARNVTLDAALTGVPLRVLRLAADLPLPEGRISGSASLRGQGNSGSGHFRLEAEDVAYPDPGQMPAAFRLAGSIEPGAIESGGPARGNPATPPGAGLLRATLSAEGLQADVAEAAATLPLRFTAGLPAPDLTGDMAADIRWRGPVAPVWRFVPLADRRLTGTGGLTASLRGPVTAPRVEADAFLCGGRYEDLVSGVLLADIQMDARREDDGTLSVRARLGDGRGGAAALEGRLSPPPSAPPGPSTSSGPHAPAFRDLTPRIDLRGRLLRLSPLHRDDLSLTLSGGVEVTGPLTAPLVRADITVPEGELRLLRGLGGGVTTLDVTDDVTEKAASPPSASATAITPPTPPPGPQLDLRIVVPQRFFIRGRGLDSEWQGDLRVSGPAASPALVGALSPVRGRFDLLAKPFTLSRGSIAFTGERPPNPALDLDLTNEGPAVTAVAHVGGTARRPALSLSSTPALPQDEVMSYVLFGKPLTELSRFEALQAANALRTLSGAGGDFDVLTSVRRTLGVDVLRVGSSDPARQRSATAPRDPSMAGSARPDGDVREGQPTLEAGKYLLDNVYVGVEQGAEPGTTGARVEVELLPRLNLEGRSSPTSSELGIMWKKDY